MSSAKADQAEYQDWFEAARSAMPLTTVAAAIANYLEWLNEGGRFSPDPDTRSFAEEVLEHVPAPILFVAPEWTLAQHLTAGKRSPEFLFVLNKVLLLDTDAPHVFDPVEDVMQVWVPAGEVQPNDMIVRQVYFRHDDDELFSAAAAAGFLSRDFHPDWGRLFSALYPLGHAQLIARVLLQGDEKLPVFPLELPVEDNGLTEEEHRNDVIATERVPGVPNVLRAEHPGRALRHITARWALRIGNAAGMTQEELGDELFRRDVTLSPEAGVRMVRRLLKDSPPGAYLPRKRGRPRKP